MIEKIVTATVLSCMVVVAACDGGSAGSENGGLPPIPRQIPIIRDASQFVFPLDSFRMTREQESALTRAESVLTERCMRRLGYSYQRPLAPPVESARFYGRIFGLIDLAEARAYGYHGAGPYGEEQRAREDAEAAEDRSAQDESLISALTGEDPEGNPVRSDQGIPKGGCLGEARSMIDQRAPSPDPQLLDQLGLLSGHRAEQDPRVVAGFRRWHDCMTAQGLDYRTPWDSNNDPAWAIDRPTPQERVVAAADVGCKQQANLPGLWYAVTVAYQKRIVDEYAQELAAYRHNLNVRVKNAADLVG